MVRTQIQLTESQARALKALSATRKVSMAELIRLSIDELIRTSAGVDEEERRRRAVAAAGRFHSSEGDLSVNHDRYLAQDDQP